MVTELHGAAQWDSMNSGSKDESTSYKSAGISKYAAQNGLLVLQKMLDSIAGLTSQRDRSAQEMVWIDQPH